MLIHTALGRVSQLFDPKVRSSRRWNTQMGAFRYLMVAVAALVVVAGSCGNDTALDPIDTAAPNPPIGVMATPDGATVVRVSWDPNSELDLAGYRLYRSSNEDGPFAPITSTTLLCPWYYAHLTPMDVTYFKATAVDRSGNESAYSLIIAVYAGSGKNDDPSIPIEQ